jgi:hypothetical protein
MQLHLVLPGLVWPSAQASGLGAGLDTPALEYLLGHANIENSAGASFERWLGRAFGLTGATLPHAALRRLGEDDRADVTGEWLCADPVHLHFARERLLLADAADLDITDAEAAALIDGLNGFLTDDETDFIAFEAGAPTRWYLRLNAPVRAHFAVLNDVVGRPVSQFLPEGEHGLRWQRLGNELQVFLHNHPVNQAREATGQRTINSVWFWGAGALPASAPTPPAARVFANDVLSRGLARAAGVEPETATALSAVTGRSARMTSQSPRDHALVVLDALHRPSLYLDLDTWRIRLAELEAQWFAPLVAALKSGRITNVRISAPGDQRSVELKLRTADVWKFWRRSRPLESLTGPRS